MIEQVRLVVDGEAFTGWTAVDVTRSVEACASSFSLELVGPGVPIKAQAEVQIYANDELMLTGFVDHVRLSFAGESMQIHVAGRSRTGDLVDSSAEMAPGEWYGLTLDALAVVIAAQVGVAVISDVEEIGPKFDRFAVQPSESCFEAIERAARLRGFLLTDDASGRLVITQPGLVRTNGALIEGVNISTASASFDRAGVFRTYKVKAQQTPGDDDVDDEECCGPEGSAQDLSARVGRTLIVIAEGIADEDTAKKRAQWEATVRGARAAEFTVQVPGWRDVAEAVGGDRQLWRPGLIVPLSIPRFGVRSDMMIKSVSFKLTGGEGGGTTSSIELCRADAYIPEPTMTFDDDPANFGGYLEVP